MSANIVTEQPVEEGTGREAVLRAMQEAAECVAGKKGVPRGPQGTKGIVILCRMTHHAPPLGDKKKEKRFDDDEEDEGSESSSIHPRNLSYSSTSARAPKSPAKRKKAAWPPKGRGDDEEDEEGEIPEESDHDDDDGSGSRHSYDGLEIAIDHVSLHDFGSRSGPRKYGIPGTTQVGVFNTLCLDGTLDEWLTGIEEANVPNAWAEDGWAGMLPGELVCVVCVHLLTILLTLGDLAVESGILTPSQSEMF